MTKLHFTLIFLFSCSITFAQGWLPVVSGTTRNLHDVHIVNNQVVYAITSDFYGDNSWSYSDMLLRSFNGGQTWDTMAMGYMFAKDVFFLNDSVGFVSGGVPSCGMAPTVMKTTNKGLTWDGFVGQSGWNVPFDAGMGYSGAYFWDADKGYIFGGNWGAKQHATVDNGLNWIDTHDFTSMQSYPDIFFWDAMNGYLVSDSTASVYDSLGQIISQTTVGYIYKTNDGGVNWALQTFANDSVTDIHFPSNNIGYVTAKTHLLKTIDAGVTWTISNLPFDSRKVAFLNNTVGFIIASDGDIYKTVDGGVSWTSDYTGDYIALDIKNGQGFAVGKNGSIAKLRGSENAIVGPNSTATFQIFPNPAKDIIQIHTNETKLFSIELYNSLGQLVITKEESQSFDLNLRKLTNDTYFLYIKDATGKVLQTEKIVKE